MTKGGVMARRELDELFRAWRSEPVPQAAPPALDDPMARAGSAVVAAALRRVAERKRRQARVRRWSAALALAATVTGLGVGAWVELGPARTVAQRAEPSVQITGQEGDVAVTDDRGRVASEVTELTEGYGVRTERGSATLGFPSGASAKVADKSSLKITRARESEVLYLTRGGVDVEVPKLDPTRGFSVETPDALVTVHGTRFSVLVEPTLDGPHTRVQVTRGIVSVQKAGHEVFLTAGQTWPSETEAPAPATPPAARSASGNVDAGSASDDRASADQANEARVGVSRIGEPVSEHGSAKQRIDEHRADNLAPTLTQRRTRPPRGSSGKPRTFDPRELAEQNERFVRAMAAKKDGDGATALRELGAILRRYPGSPLTQEVRVERLRLLRELGRYELAANEARRYLRDFPSGYAVVEAEALLPEHR
jgi:hypothetical protein